MKIFLIAILFTFLTLVFFVVGWMYIKSMSFIHWICGIEETYCEEVYPDEF